MNAIFKTIGLTGRIAALTMIAILLLAATALAHHSFTAEFDQNKPVKLTGKVTEMKWSNPHAWIYIDVTTNGKTVNWACETGGANSHGWGLLRGLRGARDVTGLNPYRPPTAASVSCGTLSAYSDVPRASYTPHPQSGDRF